jgi:hypothetical protein
LDCIAAQTFSSACGIEPTILWLREGDARRTPSGFLAASSAARMSSSPADEKKQQTYKEH